MTRVALCWLLVATTTVLSVVGGVPPAGAHADLVGSYPEAGSTVERVEEIALVFSEPVITLAGGIEVRGPGGPVPVDVRRADGGHTILAVPAEALRPGDHQVTWRVSSTDDHPISGTFDFRLAPAAPVSTAEDERSVAASESITQPSEAGASPPTAGGSLAAPPAATAPQADGGRTRVDWFTPLVLGLLAAAGTVALAGLSAHRHQPDGSTSATAGAGPTTLTASTSTSISRSTSATDPSNPKEYRHAPR